MGVRSWTDKQTDRIHKHFSTLVESAKKNEKIQHNRDIIHHYTYLCI